MGNLGLRGKLSARDALPRILGDSLVLTAIGVGMIILGAVIEVI